MLEDTRNFLIIVALQSRFLSLSFSSTGERRMVQWDPFKHFKIRRYAPINRPRRTCVMPYLLALIGCLKLGQGVLTHLQLIFPTIGNINDLKRHVVLKIERQKLAVRKFQAV